MHLPTDQTRAKARPQINVTPLIDVIMCLIIFFLLCGKFAKDEASARAKIPQSELGQTMTDQQGRLVEGELANRR